MGYAGSEIGDLECRFLRDLLLDGECPFVDGCISTVDRRTGRTGAAGGSAKTWSDGIAESRYLSLCESVLLSGKVRDGSAETAELSEAIVDSESRTEDCLAMQHLGRPCGADTWREVEEIWAIPTD